MMNMPARQTSAEKKPNKVEVKVPSAKVKQQTGLMNMPNARKESPV
jgi:hypothetical protein